MKRDNWIVLSHGVRPAGKPNRCFYCRAKIGEQHKPDCVIRARTVVVNVEVEMVVEVPESWDKDAIEFKYNESSSCSDNIIKDIERLRIRLDGKGMCMCPITKVTYLREATKGDENHQGLSVDEFPS